MVYSFLLYLLKFIKNIYTLLSKSLKMNTLIKNAGKVVATVSASHNVTVTEKQITIDLFSTTKTKTKRRGRPTGSKTRATKKTTATK